MYSFSNDYNQICCKEILDRISQEYQRQFVGYSLDEITSSAKNRIKKLANDNVDVHFLVGGTQTNAIVLATLLKPYQAVIAVESGHINVHETGAIEATGHKVLTTKGKNGKILPQEIEEVVKYHSDEHMVFPKAVYISNATEIGTIYTLKELQEIRAVCDKHNLLLFMDGARLGSALAANDNDLTLKDIAAYCDVFYIGATKNGGMLGEAVVIVNDDFKENFRYMIKQRGAMLAKGFILGIQFDELFKNDLFFKLAQHENKCAQYFQNQLKKLGCQFLIESSTNQIFPLFDNELIKILDKDFVFQIWQSGEKQSIVRLVCNYDCDIKEIDKFIDIVKNYCI